MIKKISLICFLFFTGCTYSIHMVHTEGTATDIIDEMQSPQPDISPEIVMPVPL